MYETIMAILAILGTETPAENVANNQFIQIAALAPGVRSVAVRDGGGYDVTFGHGERSAAREQIVRGLAETYQLAPVFFAESDEPDDEDEIPC